jgi:hypothetical protein
LSFDGTNDAASIPLDLSGTNNITISVWCNWTSYANNDDLMMEFTANFNSFSGGLIVDPNLSSGGNFAIGCGNDGGVSVSTYTRPAAGLHHFVFRFDKRPAVDLFDMFVDGVQLTPLSAGGAVSAVNFANSTLYIMSRAGTALFGAGTMTDLRVYDRALSANEVFALYAPQTRWELFGVPMLAAKLSNLVQQVDVTLARLGAVSGAGLAGALGAATPARFLGVTDTGLATGRASVNPARFGGVSGSGGATAGGSSSLNRVVTAAASGAASALGAVGLSRVDVASTAAGLLSTVTTSLNRAATATATGLATGLAAVGLARAVAVAGTGSLAALASVALGRVHSITTSFPVAAAVIFTTAARFISDTRSGRFIQ